MRSGRRVSSYIGFIRPLLNAGYTNLHVLANAEANHIIFEGDKAVGVKITMTNSSSFPPNTIIYPRARQEIILSAGVIESPVILMKSGIGPKADLAKYNVT